MRCVRGIRAFSFSGSFSGSFPGSFSGSFSGWFSGSFSEMGFCHRPLPKAMFVFENNWVPKTVWGREKEPHITLGASTQCEWFALDRSNSEGPFWGWAGSSNPGRAFHPPAPHPRRTLGHLQGSRKAYWSRAWVGGIRGQEPRAPRRCMGVRSVRSNA